MKIVVIGTGYVGLVAGACFADHGNDVICVDLNSRKIDALKKGEIPIYEPGLDEIVQRGLKEGRLSFTTSTAEAVRGREIIFMAVGTPALPSGESDLTYLKVASEDVGRHMSGYGLIVNKSTVPVGTHKIVASWIQAQTKYPFEVASNPEFLKEGTAVDDFLKPDRIIIGTDVRAVYERIAELYAPFVRQGNPILWMDPTSAEISKYACNAFLATRISFMNELSVLCERLGGDIEEVRRGMVTDSRIGRHFLYAGIGYGGSCFPKDVQSLISTGRKNQVALGIVEAAESANERQKHYLVKKIQSVFGDKLAGRVFGIWGLAFKPNTDDIREAPALTLITELSKLGAKIRVFDPVAMENTRKTITENVTYCESSYSAIEGADALILATEWNEFRQADFSRVKSLLKEPVIFDGRNIYDPKRMRELGFRYFGVGRKQSTV